jgi:hypothetical protein
MVLGLSVVYMRIHSAQVTAPLPAWTIAAWPRLAGLSFGFLVASYTFVRVFVKW